MQSESIIELVSRLQASGITWDEVEAYLDGYPGWLAFVGLIRYPVKPIDNRIVWGPTPVQFTNVTEDDRQKLLAFFTPFAILFDSTLSPAEKAVALRRDTGVDALRFCKDHVNDGTEDVASAAKLVIDAITGDKTLLRGGTIPTNRKEMLRPRASDGDATLLQSAEEPEARLSATRGWFARLFKR